MSEELGVFVPANEYDESNEKGRFSRFDPGTRILEKGWQFGKEFGSLTVDIQFDEDVAVQVRDGTTIYVDGFRPPGATDIPAIVAWSAYGKSRGSISSINKMRDRLGIDQTGLSRLMRCESPDPAFWVEHGYAVADSTTPTLRLPILD